METMKRGPLSSSERWGSSKEEIRDRASPAQNVPHTFHWEGSLNNIVLALWVCSLATWQEGVFMLPAKAPPLGFGLSVSAPDPFPTPSPRNFCLCNGHCISSLLLMGSGPNFLSTSSSTDMHVGGLLWEGPALDLSVSHLAPRLSLHFVWSLASLVTHWKRKSCWQDGDCLVPCWHWKGWMQSSGVNRKAPSACGWSVCPWQTLWAYSRKDCSSQNLSNLHLKEAPSYFGIRATFLQSELCF